MSSATQPDHFALPLARISRYGELAMNLALSAAWKSLTAGQYRRTIANPEEGAPVPKRAVGAST